MEARRTERLVVRNMREEDLRDFLAYQTHPDVLRLLSTEPFIEERALKFLAFQATSEVGDEGGYKAFAIHHIADDKMIGEVGIYLSPLAQDKGDIGWSLHPDYQGQGYATEAARVLLDYAFVERDLRRVTSGCDTRNTASCRLMERLGMRREGHLRQSVFIEGAWRDEYLYALLRDEWLEAAGAAGETP